MRARTFSRKLLLEMRKKGCVWVLTQNDVSFDEKFFITHYQQTRNSFQEMKSKANAFEIKHKVSMYLQSFGR